MTEFLVPEVYALMVSNAAPSRARFVLGRSNISVMELILTCGKDTWLRFFCVVLLGIVRGWVERLSEDSCQLSERSVVLEFGSECGQIVGSNP
jgi:hypothetical protein